MEQRIDSNEITLKGISTSPGICIGKAYLIGREGVDVIKKYPISPENIDKEKNRFKTAVKKTKDELNAIIDRTKKELGANTDILETHVLLMEDKMLFGKTIEVIEGERVNAEWALKKVSSKIKQMFLDMSDEYFQERGSDIVHVSDRIMSNLLGQNQVDIGAIDKRVILVAPDLSPAQTSQIHLERIMGFITERGGRSSHTGIIARTLELPAVQGLGKTLGIVNHDDIIIVDGTDGTVIVHPSEDTLIDYEEKKLVYESQKAMITRGSHLPGETLDGVRLKVMGNIELSEEVVSVLDYGGDGIGLYRTEFQYMIRKNFPDEFELFDKYRDIVEVMAPRPVTIRTLDINGDKALSMGSDSDEQNPALGLRAIRYCLKKPDIFLTQLRAILRAAAFGNVRVMFPMISSIEEVRAAKRLLGQAAESLEQEGTQYNRNIEVGIMIEVPSAVIMADELAREVDFFSIGTNDLTQYALAIDRGNSDVAHLYHPLHPAILRMLDHVAKVAGKREIKLFMCGEVAADPINVPILLGFGIDELSMNPQSIPLVKRMIRSLNVMDSKAFLSEILKETEVEVIMEMLHHTYGSLLSEKVYGK